MLRFTLMLLLVGCRAGMPASEPDATVSVAPVAAAAAAAALQATDDVPVPGRYHGFLRLPNKSARVATVLDLTFAGGTGDAARYRAFLRLAPGGFGSHEGATTYFRDVRYKDGGKSLVFAGGPDGVTLAGVTVSGDTIKGRFVSVKDSATADFEVRAGPADGVAGIFKDLPLLPHLTGNYVGQSCPDQVAGLQLEASRWRGVKPVDAGVYGGHRVSGRLGQLDELTCGSKDPCIKESFTGADYNLLTGALKLRSPRSTRSCVVRNDSLLCEGACPLKKDAATTHAVVDVTATVAKTFARAQHVEGADEDGEPRKDDGLTGQFYGYLHHEGLGTYQLVALNVRSAPEVDLASGEPKSGRQHVAAVASLYFGEGDSAELVAYRFRETAWPPEGGALVLEGDGEAVLVVREWTGRTLVGEWYGKTFGRIGTVELQRDLVPPLAAPGQLVRGISGVYEGEGWDFEITASASESGEEADFYPLKIFGFARERIVHARRRTIEDGTYDFYTGAIALRIDDGRTMLGRVVAGGMELHWSSSPRLGSVMTSGKPRLFKRTGDNPGPTARLQRR